MFLYICGEWTCSPPSAESNSAFGLGASLNAKLMVLEHRYYGDSQPFSEDQGGWSTENLKWLNVHQSLEDIANFIRSTNEKLSSKHQWVIIGGSYPGAMSAWFKSKYPDLVVAAWSSSGVVDAIEDYKMYDFDIFHSTNDTSNECSKRISEITDILQEFIYYGPSPYFYGILGDFGVENENIDYGDFMFFIADIFASGVQSGERTEMCNKILAPEWDDSWLSIMMDLQKHYGLMPSQYDTTRLQNTTIDIN